MQQRDWLYFLLDKTGKSYRIENGTVVAKALPAPLHHTPDGWQDITIGWERDLTQWGNMRNFSLPLAFVLEGQQILRNLFYNKSFDEELYLLIQKQKLFIDTNRFYFWYDLFYRGKLNLTTSVDEEDKFSINIDEGGIAKKIKSFIDQEYEIPVDELKVKMDGMTFHLTANWLMVPMTPDNGAVDAFFPAMVNTPNDGDAPNILTQSSTLDYQTGTPWDSLAWIVQNDDNIAHDFRIHGTFLLNKASGGSDHFDTFILITDDQTNITQLPLIPITGLVAGPVRQEFPFDKTFALNPGERFMIEFQRPGGTQPKVVIYESPVQVEVDSRYKTTFVNAISMGTLYKRLIEKIAGSQDNCRSDLADSYSNLVVTSGDALRGFEDGVIKTKLSDFLQSFGSILCAGSGIIDNIHRFEDRMGPEFMSTTDQISLGNIKGQKISAAVQLLINKIKIGYPAQQVDDVNGRQEWNTTAIFSAPLQAADPKELNLVSIYRADPYGIESLRRNLSGKETTDSSSDNETFILNIDLTEQTGADETEPPTFFNLLRNTYAEITGIIAVDTAFNIESLTPARMMRRWEKYLNSIFYGYEGQFLVFETSDKNQKLFTRMAATMITPEVIYDEDANVKIGSNRSFVPYIAEIEPLSPAELVENLTPNPNRCFNFIANNGLTYSGFIIKAGIAPSTRQEQAFQLLLTSENDIKTLGQ